MPTNPETGHTKNVANFQRLILLCQSFGSQYAPSNPLLSIANLQAAHTAAENSINDVAAKLVTNQTAINNRQVIFKDVGKLSTRIYNYFKITSASPQAIADVKGINSKIQGYRITPLPPKPKTNTNQTNQTTNQTNQTTNPTNQTTNQTNQTTNPTNQTTNPTNQTTNQTNQTTNPTNQTTNQTNQTTNQTNQTTNQTNQTTNQTNQTTNQTNQTTNQTNQTTNPTNQTTNQTNQTNNPTNQTTNPVPPAANLTTQTANPNKKYNSVSQQSYDNKAQFFSNYINLVAAEPTYNPAEPDLQIRTLQSKAADMKAATLAADTSTIELETSRYNRNNTLYHPETGIHFLALQIKLYIKAVFGSNSHQARQAGQYLITNPLDI